MAWCKETHAVNLTVPEKCCQICLRTVEKDEELQIYTTGCGCFYTAQCCAHAAHCIQKFSIRHTTVAAWLSVALVMCMLSLCGSSTTSESFTYNLHCHSPKLPCVMDVVLNEVFRGNTDVMMYKIYGGMEEKKKK